MLPKPDVGQLVRLEGHDARFVIKRVSDDGAVVDLVSESDPTYIINDVPCPDLLLPEGYSAD